MIELIVAFFIIGIVLAIVLPYFRSGIEKADLSSCQENLKTLSHSVIVYANEDPQKLFPTSLQQVVPKYVARIPTCGSAQSDTYSTGYTVDNNGAAPCFTICCSGSHHAGLGFKPNEPYWTARSGLGP